MFSLCIPTMDRFDTFLCKNLESYLLYEKVTEIIITDENGHDAKKISGNPKFQSAIEEGRLRVVTNNVRLGPLLNKHKVCGLAKQNWIILADSDNFIPEAYVTEAEKYITYNKLKKYTVVSPCFAKPRFDYRALVGVYRKETLKNIPKGQVGLFATLMNTGNYILSKDLMTEVSFEKEPAIVSRSAADLCTSDVLFYNTLLFEQFPDLEFHVVADMHYDHALHKQSVYTMNASKYTHEATKSGNRFKRLLT